MKIIAAADGSALGNPGPAGWGWYIDEDTWASGGWPRGTNNMGELMAVLDLLRQTRHVSELQVLCDSQYVINSVTKWMPGWKRKGWRKADGKPVLNVDLLKEIDREMAGRTVTFTWVKGHAGHPLNEAADKKANGAAQRFARGNGGDAGPGFPQPARAAAHEAAGPRDPEPAHVATDAAASPRAGAQAPAPRAGGQAPAPRGSSPAAAQEAALTWDEEGASWSIVESERSPHEEVLALERRLASPEGRADIADVAFLLHADFMEVGSSGRRYDRAEMLALIEGEEAEQAPQIEVIASRELAPGLIQLIYRAAHTDRTVLRSSMWTSQNGRWQIIWHQGTREA
ncbi:RNase H family protein [Falsarthrobacter nasiphocae]|uniref:Ribonuclease H n=1 Tax=Falsarthrobacter nasiphocae TaxID=189863 RepID=A0AAE4C651_9MICC|nr:RNase H family protein [Falsarthrobacter nasiphocae]MDR6891742.1 ribonuclease HI [Falsarthrobacter nasiphocae]